MTLLLLWAVVSPPAGAGGTLWAALASDRIPIAAEFLTQWRWQVDDQPLLPVAIGAHPSGVICGLEASRRRLFLSDTLGAGLRLASGSDGGGSLGFATQLYAGVGLQIFTLDSWNAGITRYDLQGVREAALDLAAAAEAVGEDLREAADFCLDPSGELFVLDARRGRVLHFSRAGEWITVLAESGEMSFVEPVAIDVDGRGRLYLLETRPPGLIVLDADGRLLRRSLAPEVASGASETTPGRILQNPVALVVDPWGNAFVADADGGVLVVPEQGSPPWWLNVPAGMQLSPADLGLSGARRLLIADPVAGCVWVFELHYRSGTAPRPLDGTQPGARAGG